MDITKLTSSDLKRITALLEAKEKIQAKLDQINAALVSLGEGSSSGSKPAPAPVRRRRSAGRKTSSRSNRRGALMERVSRELQAAGGAGVHIKDLSDRLGVKVPNLRVWFLTTGKKIRSIKKVAKATFAWKG